MQKMNKFDDFTKENIDEHNPNWPQIPDHPYRILIVGGSESKKNGLLNFTKRQDGDEYSIFDKIYSCVKDPNEAKHQDQECEKMVLKIRNLEDPKVFIELSKNISMSIEMSAEICRNTTY